MHLAGEVYANLASCYLPSCILHLHFIFFGLSHYFGLHQRGEIVGITLSSLLLFFGFALLVFTFDFSLDILIHAILLWLVNSFHARYPIGPTFEINSYKLNSSKYAFAMT